MGRGKGEVSNSELQFPNSDLGVYTNLIINYLHFEFHYTTREFTTNTIDGPEQKPLR